MLGSVSKTTGVVHASSTTSTSCMYYKPHEQRHLLNRRLLAPVASMSNHALPPRQPKPSSPHRFLPFPAASHQHIKPTRLLFILSCTFMATFVMPVLLLGGGGGGRGLGEHFGGGGGGGGGGWWSALAIPEEEEEEEEYEEEEYEDDDIEQSSKIRINKKNFKCIDVVFENLPEGKGLATKDELLVGMEVQPGKYVSFKQLKNDMKTIHEMGVFGNVTANIEPITPTEGVVIVKFFPLPLQQCNSITIIGNTNVLPRQEITDQIYKEIKSLNANQHTDTHAAGIIRNTIEGWYHDRGYPFGFVQSVDGKETGDWKIQVVESVINKIKVTFIDDNGNPSTKPTQIPESVVKEASPFKKGEHYQYKHGNLALQNLFKLGLFDNVQINPTINPYKPEDCEVELLVKERPPRSVEYDLDWSLAAQQRRPLPLPVSWVPGGGMSYEHRHIGKYEHNLSASINVPTFAAPTQDLQFAVLYQKPLDANDYSTGVGASSRNPASTRTYLQGHWFNSRRPSPLGIQQSIFVDRVGAKFGWMQKYSRKSRGSLLGVIQQVKMGDENGQPVKSIGSSIGGRMQGPPCTVSDTGIDRQLYIQGTLLRDTTYIKDNVILGARDVLSAEQGIQPIFNRITATLTRYVPFTKLPYTSGPASGVIHVQGGSTTGSLPLYDAFYLGGPQSCRAFEYAELGVSRRFVELSGELRVPVKGQTGYVYYDYTSDCGSGKELTGNPGEYMRTFGKGSCYGVGAQLGIVRCEYGRDCYSGSNKLMLRFGHRY